MALGRDLVRRLDLRGVAKFDFKRAPDGRLYLLEVNPRFTLWHHLGARAGVNVPALVYADLVGQPRAATRQARAGVHWCKPWDDVAAARAAGISFLRWLPWALRCEAMRVVAWDDPMPFVRGTLWRIMSRVFRWRRAAPLPTQEMRPVA
jgi:predicted ATP-grasp superfamily ATP-dependent carboligase